MAVSLVRIPQLQQINPIVDSDGRMTNEFARRLNDILDSLAYAINQVLILPDIQAAIAAAQAAADNANAAASATTSANALANSYVTGLTISSADTGTDVTITISAHTRVYATMPPTSVSVSGGTLTGVPYGTPTNPQAFIFYDQPSRTGGAVTYQRTFNNSDVAQFNNRHSVGIADLPTAGTPPKPGRPVVPPGGSYTPEQ